MYKNMLFKWAYKLDLLLNTILFRRYNYLFTLKNNCKALVLNLLMFRNDLLIRINDIQLYVFANKCTLHEYVLQSYEPYTIELFKQTIKPSMTVLDIGAQFGIFSLISARQIGGEGKVYAFEPVPSNYQLLEKNVRMNKYTNMINTIQKAVSNDQGAVDIFIYEESDSHAMYKHPTAKVKEVISIECITIDWFLKGNSVDVVKMDIEGNEPYALEGMKQTILNSDNITLFIEYAPAYLRRAGVDPEQYLNQIANLGFNIQLIDEQERCLKPLTKDFPSREDTFGNVNLYCTKRENS